MEDPPSKFRMGPQRVLAGGSTSKSGRNTCKVIHAILSSRLTQMHQLCLTSSCPRRPHPQRTPCNYFSIPQIFGSNFHCFRFKFLLTFLGDFFNSCRMDKFLPAQSESPPSLCLHSRTLFLVYLIPPSFLPPLVISDDIGVGLCGV